MSQVVPVRFKERVRELISYEPIDLGSVFVNELYKKLTQPLKYMPFVVIFPLSLIISIVIYLILGFVLVRMASVLQYGF